MTSGIRAIAEPFHWNLIERGDRIGHGIAITLDPTDWWERHGGEVLPRSEGSVLTASNSIGCPPFTRRLGPDRPTFSPPNGEPRPALPGLAIPKKPVSWAISRVFLGPVNLVTWPTLRPDATFRPALPDWRRDAVGAPRAVGSANLVAKAK